ncbi:hypothetical protein [Kribbella flavida]|nr:hypothetical protein [Kribbella flavida]
MLGFLGTAIASFLDDFRKFMGIELKRSPKKILPTADAIAHMEDTGKQFAHRHHDFLLGEAKRLVSDLVRSPKDLPRLAGRWVKLPHPNTMHLYFADRAAEFVLAHELSHHLLNHPAKAASNSSAPARRYLTQRFAEIDHEFPTDISKSHLHEFEADALALFLLLGDGADATASYGRAIDAVAAAFSALLAFDLMEELTAAQPSSNPLGLEPRNTHPMMRDRAIALLDLTGLAAPDHPDGTEFNWHLGRTVSRRVEGHALQLWACRAFMSEVLTSRLWLPRETVRGELSPMLAGAPDTLPRISMQLDGPRDQANWSLR